MHNKTVAGRILFISLCIFCMIAACISPSMENDSEKLTSQTPATQSYVQEVTLYSTPTEPPLRGTFSPVTQPTKVYEEYVCLVYEKEKVIYYNSTAISFNLVNPPMYFNYTVKPQKNQQGSYPPPSYTITFRDKKTGAILKQLGIRSDYSDPNYSPAGLSDTIKVKKSGEYLIEIGGANVKIDVQIWVKPGNDIGDINKLTCTNWPGSLWYDL